MKDPEFASLKAASAPREGFIRRNFTPKQVLTFIAAAVLLFGAILGIGLLASICGHSYEERHGLDSDGQDPISDLPESGHLVARANHVHQDPVDVNSLVILEANGIGSDLVEEFEEFTSVDDEGGVSIPISTQTELSTLYSFSRIVVTTTYTSTATHESSVLVSDDPEETDCSPSVITETQTALITVTVSPLPSSASGDGYVTVTGEPSTLTDINTDTTYLDEPTVITVSGTPSTVTDVQTDVSYTSSLPDVTVSGNPSTITDVWTDISVTDGPSDVTVSGNPSTVTDVDTSYSVTGSSVVTVIISDLWVSQPPTTITSTATTYVTATVVESTPSETVTEYYPSPAESESMTTYYTSEAKGGAFSHTSQSITATLVIDPPFPSNGTVTYPSGTVTNVPGPTTPVVVSGASSKPEPRGWTGGNGSSGLTCTVMLIAAIMLML